MRGFLIALLCWAGLVFPAAAHEVRPAYLELLETTPGVFAVTWKQPVMDGKRLKLDPVLPDACTMEDNRTDAVGATLIRRWTARCDLASGTVGIDGLDRTLTDAFLRIDRLEGDDISAVLRAGSGRIDLEKPRGAPTLSYFRIGVEHIWFGYDHLLFVLGLVLLVRPRQLLATVTAFTVSHSITLAAAALGGISLPGAPVEIVIALSIAMLGAEAIYRMRGRDTLAQRAPWIIAFGFGLVHGFGFAGALGQIGLPPGAEALALLLFNLGVEFGQVVFVGALLSAGWMLSRFRVPDLPLRTALSYAVGIIGSYWFLERMAATFLA